MLWETRGQRRSAKQREEKSPRHNLVDNMTSTPGTSESGIFFRGWREGGEGGGEWREGAG